MAPHPTQVHLFSMYLSRLSVSRVYSLHAPSLAFLVISLHSWEVNCLARKAWRWLLLTYPWRGLFPYFSIISSHVAKQAVNNCCKLGLLSCAVAGSAKSLCISSISAHNCSKTWQISSHVGILDFWKIS